MASSSQIPDKEYLYGNYQRSSNWRDALAKSMTHKSLDIPEDVNISANKSGVGGGALVGTAGIVAAAVLGAAYMFKPTPPAPIVPPTASVATQPTTPPVTPTTVFPRLYDAIEYDPATGKDTGKNVRMRQNKDGSLDQLQPDGKTWIQVVPPQNNSTQEPSPPLVFTPGG
jgi:hypothetical protein